MRRSWWVTGSTRTSSARSAWACARSGGERSTSRQRSMPRRTPSSTTSPSCQRSWRPGSTCAPHIFPSPTAPALIDHEHPGGEHVTEYAHPETIVETSYLAEQAQDSNVRVFEVDVDTASYDQDHAAGAI